MKRVPIYLIVILLFCLNAACAAVGGEVETAVEEQEVIVETVVVVATPTPDPEPEPEEEAPEDLPDLDVPQAQPGEPTVTANVDLNVRRGPGTIYSVVGALRAGNSARILGSNPARTWWKIECPGGSGECWVSGGHQFSTAENAEGVLVAAVPPPPAQPAATSVAEADAYTPTATADPAATPTATYPPATATYIASQATATPTATATGQATATATATTAAGATATPTTAAGATATPTTQADPPTPTYTPTATQAAGPPLAPFDGDSLTNPALFVNFRPTGDRQLVYNNDISSPEGDIDDWVKFNTVASQSNTTNVWLTVTCNGYDAESENWLRVTLWDGFDEQLSLRASCGDEAKRLTVLPNHDYTARIHFNGSGTYYVQYNLLIEGRR
jgi:uncharacterized protein YgiM (DUF1202 family)